MARRTILLRRAPTASIALFAALGSLAPGCAASSRFTVQTFRSPPEGWTDLSGAPASVQVERGHLDLSEDAAFIDTTDLGELSAIADVAITGGDTKGIAGLFAFDPAEEPRSFYCVALRSGAEHRVYRAADPREPIGGRGWQPDPLATPTGFHRLGIEVGPEGLRFLVDGKEVERRPADAPPRTWRVGIFQKGVKARWKNFVAGSVEGGRFDPAQHTHWGGREDAEACLAEARARESEFRQKPDRMKLYALAAPLEEAGRALAEAGEDAGAITEEASRLARELKEAARGIGEADLHRRAFDAVRVAGSTPEPGAVEAAAGSLLAPVKETIESIRARLNPLRLEFSVSSAAPRPVFDPNDFWQVLRETYGGLERARRGELSVRVRVDRSAHDRDVQKGERKVAVSGKGPRARSAERMELEALEKRLPEDLLDAEMRASVIRAASTALGPAALGSLREVQLGGKKREIHAGDQNALEHALARLEELRSKVALEDGNAVERHSVPGTLHTSSIIVEISYSVELDGKTLVRVERERTYLGIEQWSHGAREDLGIPEERVREDVVAEAVASVRSRVLGRFRTAVSTGNLLPKLERRDRLPFLIRFARATRDEADRASLQWLLRTELGLEEAALEHATRRLLE
ncbi:MAG TPA: hypothetical protein VMT52_11235 [Planctomycetota bacterium]|nr:hypothetical protein [Planctomycetota bacterium]